MSSQFQETRLNVRGMGCSSCIGHVDAALKGVAGVRRVDVDLAHGEVRVEHAAEATVEAMRAALDDAGYPCDAA